MKSEIFFDEESAKKFVACLQDGGYRYKVLYEDYWQLDEKFNCIVIYYEDLKHA